MHWLFDLVVLAIIGLCIWRAAVHGFLRTVTELAGYILAVVIALSVGRLVGNLLFTSYVRPMIVDSVSSALVSYDSATDPQVLAAEIYNGVSSSSGSPTVPAFLSGAFRAFGVTQDDIATAIQEHSVGGLRNAAPAVVDAAVKPVVTGLLMAVIALILYLLLAAIVRVVARFVGEVGHIPIVGTLDTALGAGIGLLKGIAFVCFIAWLIGFLLPLFGKAGIGPFNSSTINQTLLFKLFYDANPFVRGG